MRAIYKKAEKSPAPTTSRGTRNWRSALIAAAAIAAPLILTLTVWQNARQSQFENLQARFEGHALESEKALLNRIESYEQSLVGGVGFFRGSEEVGRAEWRNYVETIDVRGRLPGIMGIGYIADVPVDAVDAFLAGTRADGDEDFSIHPQNYKDHYFIITYIEPVAFNGRAVGLNIAFEDNRRAAANLARDTGRSVITRRILLVQDNTQSPGFLLLHPLYKGEMPTGTIAERRKAFDGWVYAPFIGNNFMAQLTTGQGALFELAVHDGSESSSDTLIYASNRDTAHEPKFSQTKRINLMQRDWTLVWTSTPAFESGLNSREPQMMLVSGLAFTLIFGLFVNVLMRQTDIVARQVTAKTLELSNERQRIKSVLGTAAGGIFTVDALGVVLVANSSAEAVFGVSADQLIGRNIADLLLKNESPIEIGDLKTFSQCDEHIELNAKRQDGFAAPVELAVNEFDENSTERYVICVHDVTERKRQQKALAASEETLRMAMAHAPIGNCHVTARGAISVVNPALCKILDRTEEDLFGAKFDDFVHPEDAAANLDYRRRLLAGDEESYQCELRLIDAEKNEIWVLLNVSVVHRPDDNSSFFIVQVQDISERMEMDRLKSEFISIVSHELRTPLTSIRGSLGLVTGAMASRIPENALQLMSIAQRNCNRLITLINDILDIDKIASGQMRFDIRKCSVGDIVRTSIEANEAFAAEFGVCVKLIEHADEIWVNVDFDRVVQVLTNLLSNAAKFSPENGSVEITIEATPQMVRISVIDEGEGIPESSRENLFDKFYQADSSATRKSGGSGLGLHICRQITEQLNGDIGYIPNPKGGSIFWFELPIASNNAPPMENLPAAIDVSTAPKSTDPRSSAPKVLHVEDDADFHHILARSLSDIATIECAASLREAKEKLSKQIYDLVILDAAMPDGNGLRLLHTESAENGAQEFVVLSANETPDKYRNMIRCAMVKSRLSEERIVETIVEILRNRKAA